MCIPQLIECGSTGLYSGCFICELIRKIFSNITIIFCVWTALHASASIGQPPCFFHQTDWLTCFRIDFMCSRLMNRPREHSIL